MKEISYTPCYINSRKCAIVSYDNNCSRILFNASTLGGGNGVENTRKEYAESGLSLHQFNNYLSIPSADVDGIRVVLGESTSVELKGTAEYDARVAAAVGTRGGAKPANVSNGVSNGVSSNVSNGVSTDLSAVISDALRGAVGGLAPMVAAAITPQINAAAAKIIDEAIKQATPADTPAVDIIRLIHPDGLVVDVEGRKHDKFPIVAQFYAGGRHVYAYGAAGTGKTVLATQLAKAFEKDFYYQQKVDDKSELFGFVDAGGRSVDTTFKKAWKNGGFLLLDEVDRYDAQALESLLGALENGFAEFPGEGRINKHSGFMCMATGNTCGRGASFEYNTANVLSEAFRARFAFVELDYCEVLDRVNAGGDDDLFNFARALRKAAKDTQTIIQVSPREIKWLRQFAGILSEADNLSANVFKGLELSQIQTLSQRVNVGGRWLKGLKKLASA